MELFLTVPAYFMAIYYLFMFIIIKIVKTTFYIFVRWSSGLNCIKEWILNKGNLIKEEKTKERRAEKSLR